MNNPIPTTMQAVQQDEPDGPLILREVPVPRPKAGQVLVRIAASPINPSDLGALGGTSYREERSYPSTPGIEGSGTVVAAGDGLLARFLNGRRVACSALQPGDGAWAQYPVRVRLPLSAAQDGLEAYVSNMSAGKVLFVMEKHA